MDRVLQLADVALPVVGDQRLAGRFRERPARQPVHVGILVDEMCRRGEGEDVGGRSRSGGIFSVTTFSR